MQSGDGWSSVADPVEDLVTAIARGSQEPTFSWAPPAKSSKGAEAIEVAESFGLELDPWQRLSLEAACGVRPDGKWAAFEVGVDVPRQNGKGGIIEGRELAGIFAWGERLILHSSHEFQTSMEAMLRMEDMLAGTPEAASMVKSVSRSHGAEGFIFKSGQRLRYRTRTKGGGRGFTGDTLILDEAMILQEPFIGALLPTLSARSMTGNPQVWYLGSAVDQLVHEHGHVFARVRARGLAGGDPSLAWLEWSASDSDVSIDELTEEFLGDAERWARANPGLGIRISEEHILKELRSMTARTFAVERMGLGDWPAGDESAVIDAEVWSQLADPRSLIASDLALAFDVTPTRSFGAIGAAGLRPDRASHVEVIDHKRGTGWMVDRIVELQESHKPKVVLCDSRSPAASMVRELEQRGVPVEMLTTAEYAQSCGAFFDAVDQSRVRHLGQVELNAAIRGAATRTLGDAWAWARKSSSADVSPLVAVTLALWGAAEVTDDLGAFVFDPAAARAAREKAERKAAAA